MNLARYQTYIVLFSRIFMVDIDNVFPDTCKYGYQNSIVFQLQIYKPHVVIFDCLLQIELFSLLKQSIATWLF